MSAKPILYFCFPYRGVGGVSLLFLRLAEELAHSGAASAFLVDYPDGFMAKHRRREDVGLIAYDDDGSVEIPDGAVAVFQSMTPWSIFPGLRLSPKARILFWNCYPFNLVPLLPGLRRQMQAHPTLAGFLLATALRGYRDKMRRLVSLMLERRSLVFQDHTNVTVTERYLGISVFDPIYLPVPAKQPDRRKMPRNRDLMQAGIRVAWIGRVVDFKYFTLKHSIAELNRLQPDIGVPIELCIVGSGEYAEKLKDDAREFQNLSISHIDYISPDKVDDFLCDQVDVLMAMGTAALEGIKLGVPTLLIDLAYRDVDPGYVFRWFHQSNGYTLGEIIGPEHIVPGNRSLRQRFDELLTDYEAVSAAAIGHFEKHHALASVGAKLLTIAHSSECTWGDLLTANVTGPGLVYSAFAFSRKRLKRT